MPVTEALLNSNGTIYAILAALETNIFGAWPLVFIFIFIIVLAFALAFKIPLEYTLILLYPLAAVLAVMDEVMVIVFFLMTLYVGYMVARAFWLSD